IQANPGQYDVTPDGLIALHQAGITQNEMNAMLAAGQPASSSPKGPAGATAAASATAASQARWRPPSVAFAEPQGTRELPLERTLLAETKSKPTSLASLAGDSALSQAFQAGVSEATRDTAARISSSAGNVAVEQAGSIVGGMFARRKPDVTYVWGVPNAVSVNVLDTTTPQFQVSFDRAPGIQPDDFIPEIVKLTPAASNNCRLVGATSGKQDARSHASADWEIYSGFVEDSVPVILRRLQPGQYQATPQSPLIPGEYAVVLRPVSKKEKFSGADVARAQGPGLLFDAVFSFQISEAAR
ncbi:MAG: hypothetical protein ACRD2D_06380, partial [Terriglobales bacterium]